MKDKVLVKLSYEEIRWKIIQALKIHFLTPELVYVFRDSFTYSLETIKNIKTFHEAKYVFIMNEVVIKWKELRWINLSGK